MVLASATFRVLVIGQKHIVILRGALPPLVLDGPACRHYRRGVSGRCLDCGFHREPANVARLHTAIYEDFFACVS